MAILMESPWYQEIFQKGIAQGVAQGEAQGIAQGIAKGIAQGVAQGEAQGERRGLLSAIELGLSLKFGQAGSELFTSVTAITELELLKSIQSHLYTSNNLESLRELINTAHSP